MARNGWMVFSPACLLSDFWHRQKWERCLPVKVTTTVCACCSYRFWSVVRPSVSSCKSWSSSGIEDQISRSQISTVYWGRSFTIWQDRFSRQPGRKSCRDDQNIPAGIFFCRDFVVLTGRIYFPGRILKKKTDSDPKSCQAAKKKILPES